MSQLRQRTLAEIVAGELRAKILSGAYGEGETLPRLADLAAQFGISAPSMRDALRVLETEGLVSVQRGRDGGAVVHRPRREKIAFTLGMVLHSDAVPLSDLLTAFRSFDPLCVAACAARRDRKKTVVPVLRANLEATKAALPDSEAFQEAARQFHVECVRNCGNQTMIVLVSALETVVAAQFRKLAVDADYFATFREQTTREESLHEHEEILELIERGDAEGAQRRARAHLSDLRWEVPPPPKSSIVDAGLL